MLAVSVVQFPFSKIKHEGVFGVVTESKFSAQGNEAIVPQVVVKLIVDQEPTLFPLHFVRI